MFLVKPDHFMGPIEWCESKLNDMDSTYNNLSLKIYQLLITKQKLYEVESKDKLIVISTFIIKTNYSI